MLAYGGSSIGPTQGARPEPIRAPWSQPQSLAPVAPAKRTGPGGADPRGQVNPSEERHEGEASPNGAVWALNPARPEASTLPALLPAPLLAVLCRHWVFCHLCRQTALPTVVRITPFRTCLPSAAGVCAPCAPFLLFPPFAHLAPSFLPSRPSQEGDSTASSGLQTLCPAGARRLAALPAGCNLLEDTLTLSLLLPLCGWHSFELQLALCKCALNE